MDLTDERVNLEELSYAEREVNKRCRFFPVMADILDAVDRYRQECRIARQRQIEDEKRHRLSSDREPSQEEIEESLREIAKIKAMLAEATASE